MKKTDFLAVKPLLSKVLLSLGGLFLAFQSVQLSQGLLGLDYSPGIRVSLLWAAMMNLYVTGAFALPGFAWPTHRLLPEDYYRIHSARAVHTLYNLLGGERYRRFLLAIYWRKAAGRFFEGTRGDLDHLMFNSKQAEFGHAIPGILLLIFSLLAVLDMKFALGIWCLTINIFFNAYPVLVQRWTRLRVQNLRNRLADK